MENSCLLTDKELIQKCQKWIMDLCISKGKAWTLSCPPNTNNDPDFLFGELISRFTSKNEILTYINNLSNV